MIIYILVSNFTYFKRKGFKVAVGVSFVPTEEVHVVPNRGVCGVCECVCARVSVVWVCVRAVCV